MTAWMVALFITVGTCRQRVWGWRGKALFWMVLRTECLCPPHSSITLLKPWTPMQRYLATGPLGKE